MALMQLRRDTTANWESVNPVLAQGEGGYELDTGKVKFGDGTTAWTGLDYVTADVFAKRSIEDDLGSLQLVGDADTPSENRYYGTDSDGQRGFHPIPEGTISAMTSNARDIVAYERGPARAGVTNTMVGTMLEGSSSQWEQTEPGTDNWARARGDQTPGWFGSGANGEQRIVWNAYINQGRASVVVTNLGSHTVKLLGRVVDDGNYAALAINRSFVRIEYAVDGALTTIQTHNPVSLALQGFRIFPVSFWVWTQGSALHLAANVAGIHLAGSAAVADALNGTLWGLNTSGMAPLFRDYYLQEG